MEYKGIDYLRKKLLHFSTRVNERYNHYDMKTQEVDYGITIPPRLRQQYQATLGWCGKAVDSLADRLIFRGFKNDILGLNEIFNLNNPDTFFDSAILSALIGSCCFAYVAKGSDPIPRIEVIEGSNATGIIDSTTGLLKEGYAVLERNDIGKAVLEAYFLPRRTDYYVDGSFSYSIKTNSLYPLLVPIIHRPDAVRPFGRSRISRSAIYWQKNAKRTLERADITAEFYSFPQKYILGMDPNAESFDKWQATLTSMLRIDKDEDGDKPVVGQFTTSSMSPFTEQLRTAAAGFAGETGLTLDDLGFVSDNPSSSEAIKASHETLRAMARKAQRCFGSGFLNVGYLARCEADEFSYLRSKFYNIKPIWAPVFEPDASSISLIGDGAIKINRAVPGYFSKETLSVMTGVEADG